MTSITSEQQTARLRSENAALAELLAVHEQTVLEQSDRIERALDELRKRSTQLERAEARIRAILDSAADGIISTDDQGVIDRFNRAAQEMFGYTADEIIGQDIDRIIQREQFVGNAVSSELAGLQHPDSQPNCSNETVGHRRDGSDIPIELRVSHMMFDGCLVYTGIARDISERRAAERELSALNKRLIAASRQAGMAEIATGVLHNVGNVLTSVNVSAAVAKDTIQNARMSRLTNAVELMRKHEHELGPYLTEDEQGKKLPTFLGKLADHLVDVQDSVIGELERLTKNIEYINKIVTAQQSHAGAHGIIELTNLHEAMNDALTMSDMSFEPQGIEIVRDYGTLPAVFTDRQRLLQILVNLIRNAGQSVMNGDSEVRRVTLRIARVDGARVCISVTDTGGGILPENITRIFSQGFTTKVGGHGFGLHSAALAAKEMGGALTVRSDGPGCGAEFLLDLPLRLQEAS